MKRKQILLTAVMAIAVAFAMTACKKNESAQTPAGTQHLSLYLTDGPGFFDKVLVEIKSVEVLVDTSKDTRRNDHNDWDEIGQKKDNDKDDRDKSKRDSSLVWENLNIKAGVYDILNLRNGLDTLLGASAIPKGSIRMLKINLGTNNSLVKNGVVYPLKWPANRPSYVLVKLRGDECEEYMPGKVRLWLDFDVNRSIVQGYNNEFYLRPIFHFYIIRTTASVAGRVKPEDAKAVLTLFNAKDTAYALPNREGYFRMRGLKDGVYSLFINASNGYADSTINNITVAAPKETSVGTIELHK